MGGLCEGSLCEAGLCEAGLCEVKMACGADGDFLDTIDIDLFEGDIIETENILTGNISDEQRDQLLKLVDQIDGSTSKEVIDFATQEEAKLPSRHKSVTDEELDRLASKNSFEATVYQTKWAVTVFKGTKYSYFMRNSTKHYIKVTSHCGCFLSYRMGKTPFQ